MVMEEVAISVGDGSSVPLFLLGKNNATQVAPPYAIPDGSLQGRKTTAPSSISELGHSNSTLE